TAAGPVAVRAQGPGVRASLSQLLGNRAPRADGRVPDTWDVEPGWYVLRLEPVDHAGGILDLTFGQPGLIPETGSSQPRSSIPLGIFDLDKAASYQIFTNSAPGLVIGPKARALPAAVAAAPLSLFQAAGASVQIPVQIPLPGMISATEVNGAPVSITA